MFEKLSQFELKSAPLAAMKVAAGSQVFGLSVDNGVRHQTQKPPLAGIFFSIKCAGRPYA